MNWDPAVTERTALHEAGHAVVAWSFGLTVGSIHLDLATQGGHADIAAYTHLNPVEQIAIRLAGYEAEQAFKPPGRKAKAMIDFRRGEQNTPRKWDPRRHTRRTKAPRARLCLCPSAFARTRG
jgi:Peptidase M50B-like